ncbi:MAG: DUF2804 domain-containing protein [Myxococcales bacterium]|nr:DUF2804 domain-containing protein [Myxococcales bacterium]
MNDPALPLAPRVLVGDGRRPAVAYGRYSQPIADPQIARLGRRARARTKRWHYTSLTLPDHFVALALADLGYAAHAFVYVAPIAGGKAVEHASLAMTQALRPVLTLAESSIGGTSTWRRKGESIDISWRDDGWHMALDWPLEDARLTGEVRIERPAGSQCLALAHEVALGQPAYTHKEAGLRAEVELQLGDERLAGTALATVDWTVGWMKRETRWKWASTCWTDPSWTGAGGQGCGLNLSAEVYEDAAGHGLENAVWLGGKVYPLGGVRFDVPAQPDANQWHIRSMVGDEVDLTFTPHGARMEKLHLGLVVSDFVQPYGVFSGVLRPPGGAEQRIDGAFGVVEDHLSRW